MRANRTRVATALIAAALLLGVFQGFDHASGVADPPPPSRPNIVFFLTDDQTMKTLQMMPYLSSDPGGSWVSFTNSFTNVSLCCPSRATHLTGQYAHNTTVISNTTGNKLKENNTVATWLHGSGYRTGLVGKYINKYPFTKTRGNYTPPGWDDWHALKLVDESASSYNYTLVENGKSVAYGASAADYNTDVVNKKALAFINATPQEQPFYLWVGYHTPHVDLSTGSPVPAPRYAKAYANWSAPISPDFNEPDVSDKPAWVRTRKPLSSTVRTKALTNYRLEASSLLAVDDSIRDVMDAVSARGQLDNTVFVFTTDNGFSRGEHRYQGKTCEYEECIRVPLMIRYPGSSNRVESRLVSNVDMASTIAELAGVTPGLPQDGMSLVPLLQDQPDVQWRAPILLEWRSTLNGGPVPKYWGVRTAQWKYIELDTGEKELYNIVSDPYELVNLSSQAKYAPLRSDLAHMVSSLKPCAGATCRQYLGNLPPTALAAPTCADVTCTFDASRSYDLDGPIVSYEWDFGDGTTGSGANVSHDYAATGPYDATLTVTDNQGTAASTPVTVSVTKPNEPPTADFTVTCAGLDCDFDGTISTDDNAIASYDWDFGDGTQASGPTVSRSYEQPADYDIRLTVTDSDGETASVTKLVSVSSAGP